jgi:hypothetical protein
LPTTFLRIDDWERAQALADTCGGSGFLDSGIS